MARIGGSIMVARNEDGVLVKSPYKKQEFTDQQLQEFVQCADPVTGPAYFLKNFFFIQHPVLGKIQYAPWEFQERLVNTYHNYRYSISMMPRQTGKSTSAAGYLLWYAMFKPDSTILVAAHKYAGAQEIMQRVRYSYEACPDHIRAGATSYNKGSIEFDNGSRIVAQTTTENTGRGMSITLLYCDEFAFVRPTIAREFWTSISPTLSTGGGAIITSTPNSDEDQFAFIWKGANKTEDEFGNQKELGINGFKAFRAYWREHPDRDDEWAEEQRNILGVERFRREMDCEFIISDETLISPTKLIDLEGVAEPLYKTGQVRWYKKPQKGRIYVVALDPSLGTGGDPSAIQVFEANSTEQVAEWRHNRTPITDQIRILVEIVKHINDTVQDPQNVYYSVENNSIGEAALLCIEQYGEQNIEGYFLSDNTVVSASGRKWRKGFNTTNRSKIAACAKLKTVIESHKMKISSPSLIGELKNFVAHGTSYAGKPGETDDLVMACLLAVRMLQVLTSYHKELDTHLTDFSEETLEPMPFVAMF